MHEQEYSGMSLRHKILNEWFTLRVHPVVFGVSSIVIIVFVLFGALFTETSGRLLSIAHETVINYSGWFYILIVGVFLVFVLWLYFSRFGSVKLGKDSEEPEYTYFAWFSMLFSAGMGIGLIFFSVAEPILHFADPPRGIHWMQPGSP